MLISKTKLNKKNFYLIILIIFIFSFLIIPKNSSAAECTVQTAKFTPSGTMVDSWYNGAEQPNVVVDIVTKNCEGKTIEVSLTEQDTGILNNDDLPHSGLDNRPIVVPTSNHIVMHLRAGEEACEAGPGYDCRYFITIYKLDTEDYESEGKPGGDLVYECDTVCLDNWIIGEIFLLDLDDPLPLEPAATINTDTTYTPLAPLPGLETSGCIDNGKPCIDTQKSDANPCPFGNYLNIMFKIFLGIAGVLAVVMIVMGGIQYMTSDLISSKEEGKKTILNAVFGLLIGLGAVLILQTINPDLLNVCLDTLPKAEIEIGGDTDIPIGETNILPSGILCTPGKSNIPNIVKSFEGKMTYEMGAKGSPGPNNTIKLDCSGFVNYVLRCANIPFTNGGTASIFSNAELVTSISGTKVNNVELGIGDLVGWKKGDSSNPKYANYGHVMIYIGDGQIKVADSHGGSDTGKALGIFPITKYKDEIKYIKRAP